MPVKMTKFGAPGPRAKSASYSDGYNRSSDKAPKHSFSSVRGGSTTTSKGAVRSGFLAGKASGGTMGSLSRPTENAYTTPGTAGRGGYRRSVGNPTQRQMGRSRQYGE